MIRFTQKFVRTLAASAGLILAAEGPAFAASVVYSASTNPTGVSGGPMTDLTHQNAYTWQLNDLNVGTTSITGARLTFFNFANWTSVRNDPYNVLFVDLLNTSTHTGNYQIASMTDNTNTGTLGLADVSDAFRMPTSGNNVSVVGATGLVSNSSLVTYVGSSYNQNLSALTAATQAAAGYDPTRVGDNTGAFGTTPVTWHLDFGTAALNALKTYIANGNNISIGLDADCHFADSNILFEIYGATVVQQAAVPEPGTLLLVASGAVAAYRRRRALARRA